MEGTAVAITRQLIPRFCTCRLSCPTSVVMSLTGLAWTLMFCPLIFMIVISASSNVVSRLAAILAPV